MTRDATPAKKITRKRPTLYPVALVVMISEDQAAALDRLAAGGPRAPHVRAALDDYLRDWEDDFGL